jgi:hypothetical protein
MIHCKFSFFFENGNLPRFVYIITVDFVSNAGCNSRWVRFHIKKVCIFTRNIKVVLLKLKVTYGYN